MAEEDREQKPDTTTKDQKDFSIRIALGSAPGIDEGEILGSSGPLNDEGGAQVEVLLNKRFWSKNNPNIGGVLGGGIFSAANSGQDGSGGDTFDLTAFGLIAQGGIVAKLGNYIVIEAMPYLGAGGASVEITGFSDGSAPYFMYGVKGGIFAQLGNSVELGIEAGYHGFSSEVELDFGGSTADLTLSGSGPRVAAVLAIKF